MDSNSTAKGRFFWEHVREGKVIDSGYFDNLVVNEGLTNMVGVTLCGVTQISSWYFGVFEGNYVPVATDTAANIAANSTECTAYQEATRPLFVPAVPTGPSCTNSANKAVFTFNANKTIYGAFLISNNVKGGTSGKLFSGAQFTSSKSVTPTDQLLISYTHNVASA